jgi:cytochrome c biogenesis factor
MTEGDQSHPVYFTMMMILTPVVLLLGYYGGQMTFPAEK